MISFSLCVWMSVCVCVGGGVGGSRWASMGGPVRFYRKEPTKYWYWAFHEQKECVWNGPRHLCLWIGVTLGSPTLAALRSALPSSLVLPSWTLYVHHIYLLTSSFYEPSQYLAYHFRELFCLSKTNLSYTNLTSMAQEKGNVGIFLSPLFFPQWVNAWWKNHRDLKRNPKLQKNFALMITCRVEHWCLTQDFRVLVTLMVTSLF